MWKRIFRYFFNRAEPEPEPMGTSVCAYCYYGEDSGETIRYFMRCFKNVTKVTDSVTGVTKYSGAVKCKDKNPRGHCKDFESQYYEPPQNPKVFAVSSCSNPLSCIKKPTPIPAKEYKC